LKQVPGLLHLPHWVSVLCSYGHYDIPCEQMEWVVIGTWLTESQLLWGSCGHWLRSICKMEIFCICNFNLSSHEDMSMCHMATKINTWLALDHNLLLILKSHSGWVSSVGSHRSLVGKGKRRRLFETLLIV
jgi:hypothetical protein